jgi:hypothetical protein
VKTGVTLSIICLLTLTACASQEARQTVPPVDPDPAVSPSPKTAHTGQPFAGLWLGEHEQGGVAILGVLAGPAAVAGLQRGDRIVEIDRIAVDAVTANRLIRSSAPGDRLAMVVIRDGQPMAVTLEVDTRARWATPGSYSASVPFTATGLPDPAIATGKTVAALSEALDALPESKPIDAGLNRMFIALARDDTGFHKLPVIRSAFLDPARMGRWRDALTQAMHPFEFDRHAVVGTMCETLAISCPAAPPESAGVTTLQTFTQALGDANNKVRDVFANAGSDRTQSYADLQFLLRTTAADRTLINQPNLLAGVRAMQLSMRVQYGSLLQAGQDLMANAKRLPDTSGPSRQPPDELQDAVRGSIIDLIRIDEGYVVIGGPGDNHYTMDRLYAVIDTGGSDTYQWAGAVPPETQTIVDLAGNDRYHAETGGPGAGWLGVSVLIDLEGDDVYESALGGCGAGALGFGFLFDDAGADIYRCAAWSSGAGVYGAGALVDLGSDADVYVSEVFSQGVGGPRGAGILIDAAGGDFYRANGPVQSAYGSAASFMGFSQGVGVGIRPYDVGGVGILLDFSGDDRYEGGEFSQGGGYYWGVGLLADAGGNDLYYGNRYAQGFAAHQAFGMLSDMSGDDVYWAMTAAGQAAAWDQSIAMLFEGGGDDTYRAQTLSQGAAAQQSRALLRDVSGDDTYRASGRNTQGAAGDNAYHFQPQHPVYSLGVLVDEAGDDRYSSGLLNGETLLRRDSKAPSGLGVAGIARDLK